jgi:DNA segregation ATPase FtsK/SpoIIIE-like protein
MRYLPARPVSRPVQRRRNPDEVHASQLVDEEYVPALEIQPGDLSDEGIEHLTASQAAALQEELKKVQRFNARTMGEISTKKSRIAELTAKLRGTHGLEESLRWLRGRARSLKGDLDVDRAAKAIRLLPGWRAEAAPAKKVVPLNGNTQFEKFPKAMLALETAQGIQHPKSEREDWDLPKHKETKESSNARDRDGEPADRLFNEAVQVIAEHDRASSSLLQRRLRVGYARAARIIDELEEKGYVGPADRSNARVVNRDKIAADAAGANGGSTGGTSAAGETGEDA